MVSRILVVEDDQSTRELYESLLKGAGYEVESAIDGEKGFEKALKGNFDLILLDMMLPLKDGLTFLKDWQKQSPQINSKIVLLTVLDQDEFIKGAFELGAEGYLMKSSLTPDEVLAEVKSFLDQNN